MAAGITGHSTVCPSLESDTGPLTWLFVSDGHLSIGSSSIYNCQSSSESDQAVALCWLSLLASERLLCAYHILVVADIRQCNDRVGWLLLAVAAHEFEAWSQKYLHH